MMLCSLSQITHVLDQVMVSRQRVTLRVGASALPSRILALDVGGRCFQLKQPWQGAPASLTQPGTPFTLTAMYQGCLVLLTATITEAPPGADPTTLFARFPSSMQVCDACVLAITP